MLKAALQLLLIGVVAMRVEPLAAQAHEPAPDPLAPLIDEAIRNSLVLEDARLAEAGAAAAVREARGLFLPSLRLESRYSDQRGTLDFGDVVNPIHATLNQLSGVNRFPTGLRLDLPFAHESRVRLTQTLMDVGIVANHSRTRHVREIARHERLAVARRIAAEVQGGYLELAAARTAVAVHEAALRRVEEAERVAQRLLTAGKTTPDAVFRARADRAGIEQDLLESRQRVRAAQRALNRVLGRPLDAPVDAPPDSLWRVEIGITEAAAVTHALSHREELMQARSGIAAADAAVRVSTAEFLPRVSLAFDYGFQGPEPTFRADEDFFTASAIVSWSLFSGGGKAARHQLASRNAERARVQRRDLEEQIRLEVRQAYEAAEVAREAIAAADERLAAARRTFQLVERRYEEGVASQLDFVDARTALTRAELNRVGTAFGYALRYVELERVAALRDIDPD